MLRRTLKRKKPQLLRQLGSLSENPQRGIVVLSTKTVFLCSAVFEMERFRSGKIGNADLCFVLIYSFSHENV